jgi:hypothetical protein
VLRRGLSGELHENWGILVASHRLLDPVFLSLADEVIDDIERGVFRQIDHAAYLWLPMTFPYRKFAQR